MRRRQLAALAALLWSCGEAGAHGSAKGLGTFIGGIAHPLIEPTHLIAMVGFGLVVGQRTLDMSVAPVLWFLGAAAAGLVAAGLGWSLDTDIALLAISALSGLAVAAAVRVPRPVYIAAAALIGGGIGVGWQPETASTPALVVTLLGVGFGILLWTLNLAAVVQLLKRPWLLILVRVAGSWTTATSVLVLALWLSGKSPAAADQPANAAAATGQVGKVR